MQDNLLSKGIAWLTKVTKWVTQPSSVSQKAMSVVVFSIVEVDFQKFTLKKTARLKQTKGGLVTVLVAVPNMLITMEIGGGQK